MDETVQQLLTEIQQKGPKREQALERLLTITPQLPGMRQDSLPDYLEAVNTTLLSVKRNINQFFQKCLQWKLDLKKNPAPLVRKHYVKWVNGMLKYDILDLYRKTNTEISLNTTVGGDEGGEWIDLLSNEGFDAPTLDYLDASIAHQQTQKTQRKGLVLELYVEHDPEEKLRRFHPPSRPDCNAQAIIKYFYLSARGDKITVKENWVTVNNRREQRIIKSTAVTVLAKQEPKKKLGNFCQGK